MKDFHLPTDGSVLVIDDNIEEAKPLLKMLSSRGISYTYYSGNDDEYPQQAVQKVRLAFFDIQLIQMSSSHQYAQIILGILERLIPEDNGPYVMVLWSQRLELHAAEVKRQVNANNQVRRPLAIIELDKSDYFESTEHPSYDDDISELTNDLHTIFPDDQTSNVVDLVKRIFPPSTQWELKEDAFSRILEKLQTELLAKVNCFQLFTLWESHVKKASGKTVSAYSEPHSNTPYWNENIKYTIYRMAHAQAAQSSFGLDNSGLMENALRTLNQTFMDDVENCIHEVGHFSANISISNNDIYYTGSFKKVDYRLRMNTTNGKYQFYKGTELIPPGHPGSQNFINLRKTLDKYFKSKNDNDGIKAFDKIVKLYEEVKPEINSKLHIDNALITYLKPGNLYEVRDISDDRRKELLKNYFHEGEGNSHLYSDKKGYKKNILSLKKIHFIELEVTPPCDYAQRKWLKSRVLPGILIPEEFFNYSYSGSANKKKDYIYSLPIIKYNNKNYQLLFDFRLFKSVDHEHMDGMKDALLFRLRQEVHADIISKLSNHVNRLGIAELVL
ncbi:hypothetical protein [Kangiella sp. M94]